MVALLSRTEAFLGHHMPDRDHMTASQPDNSEIQMSSQALADVTLKHSLL